MIANKALHSFIFIIILGVTGCMPQLLSEDNMTPHESTQAVSSNRTISISSEALLEFEGHGELTEDTEPLSPLEAHLHARRQVKPTDRPSKTARYTSKGSWEQEKIHTRTLRLNPDRQTKVTLLDPVTKNMQHERPHSKYRVPLHHSTPGKPSKFGKENLEATTPQKRAAKAFPETANTQKDTAATKAPKKYEAYVKKIRTGEHTGKTRIVLDTDSPAQYEYVIDKKRTALLVKLPQAMWNARMNRTYTNKPLLKSYKARASEEGGTILMINMKHQFHVLSARTLKPQGRYGNRIVLDIKKGRR